MEPRRLTGSLDPGPGSNWIHVKFQVQSTKLNQIPSTKFQGGASSTTGTQPSGCRGVSIAPCCSVNAAFLFAEPRTLVVEDAPNSKALDAGSPMHNSEAVALALCTGEPASSALELGAS